VKHRHTRRRTATWAAAAVGVGLAGVLAATLAPSALATSSSAAAARSAAAMIPATTASAVVLPHVAAVTTASTSPESVQNCWTPARLASATPEDGTTAPAGAGKTAVSRQQPQTLGQLARAASAEPAGVPQPYFNSRPSIGVVVYATSNLSAHYCTASVVQSATKNVIMMAAHCRPGSWMAFVPDYQPGIKNQWYGIWKVTSAYTDTRYRATGAGTEYDYAFAKVAPDSRGRLLQNVVGGNILERTPSYSNWVGVTGYPMVADAKADKAITCWNETTKVPGYTQMQFLCNGYYAGTSGSPWLVGLNRKTNTGAVIGLIGGLDYGGPNSWISYSPIFTSSTIALLNYAVAH
jgi:V8-like Glu-specific endopeptidase